MTDTAEQVLREHLDRHTAAVPGGPDLDRSLHDGRRRRRHRSLGMGAAALATAAVVGTVAVAGLTGTDDDATPSAASDHGSADTDYVAGTDVDERLAALVAERLPSFPEPDDVYPSDENTAGPLPDDAFARATEWQATYTVEPGHQVLVLMGEPVPGDDPATACDGAGVPVAGCDVQQEPAGAVLVSQEYSTDDGFTFFTTQVDADGFRVSLLDTVATQDRAQAVAARIDETRVRDLVTDPRFTFEPGS